MELKVLTEIPYFEQRPVVAEYVNEDENGYYSTQQPGLVIDKDLFFYVNENGLTVDRFIPREDGKVVVGIDQSDVVFPQVNEFCVTNVDYDVAANMTIGEFLVYLIQLREVRDEENGS